MTVLASIPSHEQSSRLTAQEQQQLRAIIAERVQTHRDRAVSASAALDNFTSRDSPHERELAREALQSWRAGLSDYEEALSRLDSGTYGVCVVCAGPIPFERLEAIPEVNHCVGCIHLR